MLRGSNPEGNAATAVRQKCARFQPAMRDPSGELEGTLQFWGKRNKAPIIQSPEEVNGRLDRRYSHQALDNREERRGNYRGR